MTLVARAIATTTGYIGAPGVNIFHYTRGLGPEVSDSDSADQFLPELLACLEGYASIMPAGLTCTVSPDVSYFNDDDGVILGVTSYTGSTLSFTGSSSLLNTTRAMQLTVRHKTDQFVGGRRLQGRTFVGPITGDAIGNDGQVESGWIDDTPTIWSGAISGIGGRLAVWHRPTEAAPSSGAYGDVVTVLANATPGTLRSRKT